MRYFFEIAYKGTAYHGWQRQKNALSVQQVVEEKLSTLYRETIEITGSGRTDAGVHCEQQFFHADIQNVLSPEDRFRINSFLPDDIVIRHIFRVNEDAHARFDAVERRYLYRILRDPDPFSMDTSYAFFRPLNIDAMKQAGQLLIGEKDFKCFSKVHTDVKNFTCNIFLAEWQDTEEMLIFDIRANRFLRGMVRAIVGTLLEIGEGKRTIEKLSGLLQSGDRKLAGAAAPAVGLSLVSVRYPYELVKIA